MSKKQRQSLKLCEPGSFDMCKNATVPMIAILGHPELDIEVLDTDMKTIKSDDCRGISRNDRDANSVLAAMYERVRFSYKDGQKFIDPFTQSISGLCWVSQLYLKTKEQEESSRVT